jgi:hypothetical protein
MNSARFRWGLVLVPCFFVVALALQVAGQATSGNLFKDVVERKNDIQWRTYNAPKLPEQVCNLLSVCTGEKEEPKVVTLAPATIDGRRVGRGLFLTQVKDPQHPAVVLEHQTTSEAYFFLLSPQGNLQRTVYLEQGKPFLVIANELARPAFERDKKDWLEWASKLGPAKH